MRTQNSDASGSAGPSASGVAPARVDPSAPEARKEQLACTDRFVVHARQIGRRRPVPMHRRSPRGFSDARRNRFPRASPDARPQQDRQARLRPMREHTRTSPRHHGERRSDHDISANPIVAGRINSPRRVTRKITVRMRYSAGVRWPFGPPSQTPPVMQCVLAAITAKLCSISK